MVKVGAGGDELVTLARSLKGSSTSSGRRLVGLAGAPGAGKSTLAAALARLADIEVAVVPMDGFHLADVELRRQGLLDRKGAPETFDAGGYAALLGRLRHPAAATVYAPGFDRTIEQPLAGAIAIGSDVEVVVTEGNYLLLDTVPWPAVRAALDQVWFVQTKPELRRHRLVARHVASGKTEQEARHWVAQVDEPNAALVAESHQRADLFLDLTDWVDSA